MKNKIHVLNNGISSNFSKIREIQIRSLLHFNKRLHDLYQDLKKTKQDIDGLRTVTKDLKASNSATSSNVEDRIANLQRSKKNFDVAIRVLWKKIGNLHHDMTLFRRITTAIEANMNSIRKKVKEIFSLNITKKALMCGRLIDQSKGEIIVGFF